MNKEYVSDELMMLACSKGFKASIGYICWGGEVKKSVLTAVPQSHLQKWLRDEHFIYITILKECLGSDEWEWSWSIEWLPKKHLERETEGWIL